MSLAMLDGLKVNLLERCSAAAAEGLVPAEETCFLDMSVLL